MQIDDILSALATIRQRMMVIDGVYDADQVRTRMLVISVMRDSVLTDDAKAFTDYCQHKLSTAADLMSDLLDEMFEELGLGYEATWEQFEEKFL
jgi:hypothetical protein